MAVVDRVRSHNRAAAEGAALGAEALLDEADASVRTAFFTDSESVHGFVLVGIAIRGEAAGTMIIPSQDYDGFKLFALVQRPPVSAESSPALAPPVR